MKKILIVVFAIGALLWAKKRFLDAPAPVVPSKAEVTAEKLGKFAKTRLSGGQAVLPAAGQPTGQPAPETTSQATPEERSLAAMLTSLIHRDAGTPEEKAKKRMEAVMAAWKEGGTSLNDAAQAAACLWSRGVRFIPDRDEIQDAAMGFDKWRRDKSLYTDVQSYTVGRVLGRDSNPGRGDYSVIEVTINGEPHHVGVPDRNNPLFWIQ
jgi:hypothetical protein